MLVYVLIKEQKINGNEIRIHYNFPYSFKTEVVIGQAITVYRQNLESYRINFHELL